MDSAITSNVERGVTTLVSDVEHIESQSLNGIAVIKVFFQPGANIQTALAQTAAIFANLFTIPAARNHAASGDHLFRFDGAGYSDRPDQRYAQRAAAVRFRQLFYPHAARDRAGRRHSVPLRGKQRIVSVDIDPTALQAKGLSAVDIVNAVNAQNLILPPVPRSLAHLSTTWR